MVDALPLSQVNSCDLARPEADGVMAVGCAWPDSDVLATKSFRHLPKPAFEADVVFRGADAANDLVLIVVYAGQPIRHRSATDLVAVCRHVLPQRLVRTYNVVDRAPVIK